MGLLAFQHVTLSLLVSQHLPLSFQLLNTKPSALSGLCKLINHLECLMKRINHRELKAKLEAAYKEAIRERDLELITKIAGQLKQYKEVSHGYRR